MHKVNTAIIGDVMIDHIIDASDIDLADRRNASAVFFKPIRTAIGGNSVFFAEAAREAGFNEITLLSVLGSEIIDHGQPDISARIVIDTMKQKSISVQYALSNNHRTGQVVIIYRDNDQRIMFADRGANAAFLEDSVPDIDERLLEATDLLYVSGYMLLNPSQRNTVNQIVRRFRNYNTFVSVDVVPHDIFHTTSFQDFLSWVNDYNAITIEGTTLRGFLNLDEDSQNTRQFMVDILMESFDYCIIRLNTKSEFMIANKSEKIVVHVPYLDRAASLRFTDRVISHALLSYFIHNKSISDRQWVDRVASITSGESP